MFIQLVKPSDMETIDGLKPIGIHNEEHKTILANMLLLSKQKEEKCPTVWDYVSIKDYQQTFGEYLTFHVIEELIELGFIEPSTNWRNWSYRLTDKTLVAFWAYIKIDWIRELLSIAAYSKMPADFKCKGRRGYKAVTIRKE